MDLTINYDCNKTAVYFTVFEHYLNTCIEPIVL